MQAFGYVIYIVIGSIVGTIYGLLFLIQKRGAFSRIQIQESENPDEQPYLPPGILPSFLWMVLRLLLLTAVLLYLLPLPTIPLILVLLSFFISFGIVIGRCGLKYE